MPPINKPLSDAKQGEYLLRILNITSEMFKWSLKGETLYGTKNPKELLALIKTKSQEYIQQLLDEKNEGKKRTLKVRLFEKDK